MLLGLEPDLLQVEILVLPLDLGPGGSLGFDSLGVSLGAQLHLVLQRAPPHRLLLGHALLLLLQVLFLHEEKKYNFPRRNDHCFLSVMCGPDPDTAFQVNPDPNPDPEFSSPQIEKNNSENLFTKMQFTYPQAGLH